MTFGFILWWFFNGQVGKRNTWQGRRLKSIRTSDQITYVVFIKIGVNFQFISSHSALEWIKHRPLWNASSREHCCNLFSWLFATGCRQDKWKFLWYQNLCFHFCSKRPINYMISLSRISIFMLFLWSPVKYGLFLSLRLCAGIKITDMPDSCTTCAIHFAR